MKKLFLLAIALAFGLTVTSCDTSNEGGGGRQPVTYSGTSGGATYTLTVSPPAGRAVLSGDTYVLIVRRGGSDQTSAGTVTVNSGGFVLRPSAANALTFSVTVNASGGSITSITGTITFTDGTTEVGPGSISSGGANEDGILTVTAIPSKYNGKWAAFWVLGSSNSGGDGSPPGSSNPGSGGGFSIGNNVLVAGFDFEHSDPNTYTLAFVQISNGQVRLPMILFEDSSKGYWDREPDSITRYYGNHTITKNDDSSLAFFVYDRQESTNPEEGIIAWIEFQSITFTNGSATISCNQGTDRTEDLGGSSGGTEEPGPPSGPGGLTYVFASGTATTGQQVAILFSTGNPQTGDYYMIKVNDVEVSKGMVQVAGANITFVPDNSGTVFYGYLSSVALTMPNIPVAGGTISIAVSLPGVGGGGSGGGGSSGAVVLTYNGTTPTGQQVQTIFTTTAAGPMSGDDYLIKVDGLEVARGTIQVQSIIQGKNITFVPSGGAVFYGQLVHLALFVFNIPISGGAISVTSSDSGELVFSGE